MQSFTFTVFLLLVARGEYTYCFYVKTIISGLICDLIFQLKFECYTDVDKGGLLFCCLPMTYETEHLTGYTLNTQHVRCLISNKITHTHLTLELA